ncbi:epoxide hydrolase family protein [Nonomuraea sediminis]|uniref:epoxide hydrolase family protein n=1 Tax=Nonomuraea sediminis TaxID=2835864 RepID=UPI001BDCD450|nr:epoxide hydrolase [Nonomuraea sediminis]
MKPFRIGIPQSDLDDLRDRLAGTRWPARLPGADWSRGVPVAYLKDLAGYWADGFDWRAQEARLNAFPQFTTEIDGQPIHFFHIRSADPGALPLIITHSWPNSVAEFMNVLGPLSETFHVVAPSLPGFGFSPFPEPADERPWSIERVALTWAELMARLGYERYGAHGNDAGALVSPRLAVVAPERVVAVHITAGLGIPAGDWGPGSGYGPYLANRPQTLSYGWADSPIAQLAYLVERFHEFDQTTEENLDRDLVLTNASLYWLTNTGGSSSWTYYEGAAGLPIDQDLVPTGVSHGGPEEFRRNAERGNDITHWADNPHTSHMVAMATPEPLIADIRAFFAQEAPAIRGAGRAI